MAGVNSEPEGWKLFPSLMDSAADSNVDGRSDKNLSNDGLVMHFSSARPVPTSGQKAVIPNTTQFTIFYKGNMCTYDGIPAEKVREIMLIAGASAKSAEMKSGVPFTSFIPTSPSSQGNSNNLASPQSVCFPAEKGSICRLQEFPIARRQSLQRFLEKRRKRLGSKAPYAFSPTKVADSNFCADNTSDFASLNFDRRDFNLVLLPLEGN
ncbi:protein TIFY 3B-like isoform X1 [Abrus precatorius]|uniref:Protein TIFY n=1 Tax=Abrus precatorius TaxID=3816 RepID=A0A8B8JH42_ABRPR|nr:protein TIFY 3B-like isoform X1 [Abrus precatorius]